MTDPFFGELTYSVGWKAKREITLFGSAYTVTVKIQAYEPDAAMPPAQQSACCSYAEQEIGYLAQIEQLMLADSPNAAKRFTPRTLLFKVSGACALLCDDAKDEDGGIAVQIIPQPRVLLQDDFL